MPTAWDRDPGQLFSMIGAELIKDGKRLENRRARIQIGSIATAVAGLVTLALFRLGDPLWTTCLLATLVPAIPTLILLRCRRPPAGLPNHLASIPGCQRERNGMGVKYAKASVDGRPGVAVYLQSQYESAATVTVVIAPRTLAFWRRYENLRYTVVVPPSGFARLVVPLAGVERPALGHVSLPLGMDVEYADENLETLQSRLVSGRAIRHDSSLRLSVGYLEQAVIAVAVLSPNATRRWRLLRPNRIWLWFRRDLSQYELSEGIEFLDRGYAEPNLATVTNAHERRLSA